VPSYLAPRLTSLNCSRYPVAYFSDAPLPSPPRPVVVTGAGIISPMGLGWGENLAGFRAGRTAFSPVTLFDVSRQRVGTAGQADLPDHAPDGGISRKGWSRMDRGTRLAWWAAREAMTEAGLTGDDMPVMIGTSAAAMPIGENYYKQALATTSGRACQFQRVEMYQAQRQMTDMARELGVTGPMRIISNACASGANAIGHAFHLVRSGRADRVLAGGYDALCQLVFCGFDALQALSPSGIPRPFDAARDGLALGEGAGFVVVESAASAKARGARVIAEILGYGAATDIHHLTQPNPLGDAALATMQAACAMAGLAPEQIDYINSHGTGTPLNDIAEGNAIQRWAGEAVGRIQVSSTKSSIGHLLGGAGALESVISLMALEGQFLPASLNVREADAVCTFDLVRSPREAVVHRALTNSFGFGGANATLIFGKEGLA
jgi:3-oxoacyl-[acyl-carrier-protein] synthase II